MLRLLWLHFLSHLQRERAHWLHWVTILRSRQLRMMDLELTRWKHVGLFYKQLKSSPQTVFLNSVFSVRTAGFSERGGKGNNALKGLL